MSRTDTTDAAPPPEDARASAPGSILPPQTLRKSFKLLHTLASCGLVGALLAYAVVLIGADAADPRAYAAARQTIAALCGSLLIPSLAVALITGLLAMAVHRPFMDTRWAWLKALLGMSMFEASFAIVQSKATAAAVEAGRLAAGDGEPGALAAVVGNEWGSLGAIVALAVAQIALGVWRPRLARR